MTGPISIQRQVHAPGAVMAEHAHSAAYFCVLQTGRLIDETGHRKAEFRGGEVFFRPAGEEHRNVFCSEVSYFLLTLNPAWLRHCGLDSDAFLHMERLPSEWLRRMRGLLASRHQDLLQLQAAVLEIFASQRLARRHPDIFQLFSTLEATVQDWVAVHDSGRWLSDLGVTRTDAERAVRASTGLSLPAWLRDLRLERARELLVTTALPMSVIAQQCGFSDQAHMSRAVKACFGTTPTALRKSSN